MDTLNLLVKTFSNNFINSYRAHSVHFNVTGPNFYGLHKLLQKIYEDSEAIQDDLGELIRSLGAFAPESIEEILSHAELDTGKPPGEDTIDLLEFVLDGQEYMIECYNLLEEAAEEEEHDDIANFAQDRLRKHKKNAWMIRASLES